MDLATDATIDYAENYISANIPEEANGGGFKTAMSIALVSGGLGSIIYGITKNSDVSSSVSRGNAKAAVDAESTRNMSYGIGAGLLAGGLTVYIVF